MTEPDIRPGVPEDAEALAEFAARTFHETFAPDNRAEDMESYAAEAFDVGRTERDLCDPAVSVLLARVDGVLAGYAALRQGPAPSSVPGDSPFELSRLYVDRPWHGTRIARDLMAACVDEAVRRGHTTVWLGVWERNDRAIAFYRKCGFSVCGTTVFQLGSDAQRDLLMVRHVP